METKVFIVRDKENSGYYPADAASIADIAAIIKAGGLVALPTETVYGLGCDGTNPSAVKNIYEAKGRPETKPISLLIGGIEDMPALARSIPDTAVKLAERFWPGPLTIVLEKSAAVPDIVAAGGTTVGLRCPAHAVTLAVIRESGVPIAAPSANLSGGPSPKSADEVLNALSGKIDAVVDGGISSVGVESTIIDVTSRPPKILRLGGLSVREIADVIGDVEV